MGKVGNYKYLSGQKGCYATMPLSSYFVHWCHFLTTIGDDY